MVSSDLIVKKFGTALKKTSTILMSGKVNKVVGLVLESDGPKASIGEVCLLINKSGKEVCKTEIVGFRENRILSMVLGELKEISPGMEIVATGESLSINCGDGMLGRVLGGLGNPLDKKGKILVQQRRSIYASAPNPLSRKRITEPLATGIKAIDGLLTIGKGQRVGIFSGSGVGKSTLVGMIARNTSADVNVIALIGERGREVREFIEKDLGESGLRRTVLVVATGDESPLVRVKAALTATTIAEYFRDRGLDVLFMMDSATRLAMAQREVGLSIGEPPTTKGYTPSVFTLLQKTMERAGTSYEGTITGLYSVLVEGDDFNEPISDAARGILDGHIMLSRKIASYGHYPAIDVLESISRVMKDVISTEHKKAASEMKELLATYRNIEDLLSVGAFVKGINQKSDRAIQLNDIINQFLMQEIEESVMYEDITKNVIQISKL